MDPRIMDPRIKSIAAPIDLSAPLADPAAGDSHQTLPIKLERVMGIEPT